MINLPEILLIKKGTQFLDDGIEEKFWKWKDNCIFK